MNTAEEERRNREDGCMYVFVTICPKCKNENKFSFNSRLNFTESFTNKPHKQLSVFQGRKIYCKCGFGWEIIDKIIIEHSYELKEMKGSYDLYLRIEAIEW